MLFMIICHFVYVCVWVSLSSQTLSVSPSQSLSITFTGSAFERLEITATFRGEFLCNSEAATGSIDVEFRIITDMQSHQCQPMSSSNHKVGKIWQCRQQQLQHKRPSGKVVDLKKKYIYMYTYIDLLPSALTHFHSHSRHLAVSCAAEMLSNPAGALNFRQKRVNSFCYCYCTFSIFYVALITFR